MSHEINYSRRRFVAGAGGAALAGAGMLSAARPAFAQTYPERNLSVLIPSNQGGGIERYGRSFTDLWSEILGVNFEYEFHPGASGQVGYEVYAHRKEHDGYTLLFGNMGPEILMYSLQSPGYRIPEDVMYFAAHATFPTVLYVAADSPLQSIDDLISEGKSRTLNVSVSRLPHPSSISALLFADEVGASVNLVPYGGGNPTTMAVLTGEVDAGIGPAGTPVALGDQVRILCVFDEPGDYEAALEGVPYVKDDMNLPVPEIGTVTGWAIHTSVWEGQPEVRQRLEETIVQVFEDPRLKEAYESIGMPSEGLKYRDEAWCRTYFAQVSDLAKRYAHLITA